MSKADATQLPFPDGYFDCVYSFGVLHHIPEIDKVIGEARRVLKPEGILMIVLYHKWSVFHLIKWILLQGLARGWLFRKGYAGLLATIEMGADGVTVKPYVKLYSKTDVCRLLNTYEIEDVSIHQLKLDHFFPSYIASGLSRILPSLRNFPKLERYLGRYVACKARRSVDLQLIVGR